MNASRLSIKRLQVDGGFLDGLDLPFGQGLNVLIGARGTGKTSVIELLRYCLDAPTLADRFGSRAREHALSILRDGQATLTLDVAGELHQIERSAREEPVSVPWRRPIVLSQGEVEVVGTDDRGRLRLLEGFRVNDQATSRAALAAVSNVKSLTRELADLDADIERLAQRVAGIEAAQDARRDAERTAAEGELSAVRLAEEAARTDALERSAESLAAWRELIERATRFAPRLEAWPGAGADMDQLMPVRAITAEVLGHLTASGERLLAGEKRLRGLLESQRARVGELDGQSRSVRRKAEELQAGAGAAARLLTWIFQ